MDTIALDCVPASVATARGFVASRLEAHDLDAADAILLTSELVTNVLRHAQTEFALVVILDGCLRVEVHNGVAATEAFREIIGNPPLDTPADTPGGRGLGLVRRMASRFGLADEPGARDGKIVWFELDFADLARTQPR